jgi:hypothetical protein
MKRPAFLGTYVVLAAAAGLGAYVYLVEWKREVKPDEKPREKVLTFDRAKAKELSLTTGDETVQLVKDKDAWRMTAPVAAPADTGEVDGILATLSSLDTDDVVTENPDSLADYGLEKPRSTVTVVVDGVPEPLKLIVGEKTPDGGAVYAKLPSQPRVFTLPSYVEGSLAKKPFDLRDRDVLHVKRDDVTSLEVAGPEGAFALARDDRGEWVFTSPIRTRAGRWSVDGLLGTLESLRMDAVAAENAEDAKAYGLDKPSRTVTLGLPGGARKTLEIGSPAGEKKRHVRLAGSTQIAVIPDGVVDDLAKGMGELRAKRVLDVATHDVEGFDVEVDGARRVHAKSTEKGKDGAPETTKWRRTEPEAKDLDTTKVQDALFGVGGLEVLEFVDAPAGAAPYGLDRPALKVTLRFAGGKPPAWFEIASRDGAWYARRVDDQSVLKVDAAKAEALVKQFRDL